MKNCPTCGQATEEDREWKRGDQIHGFANGYFGSDSYACRVVVHIEDEYLFTMSADGAQSISIADANLITDPNDRFHCEYNGDTCALERRGR